MAQPAHCLHCIPHRVLHDSSPLCTLRSSSLRTLQQTSRRAYSSQPPKDKNGIKVLPFVALLGLCSISYTLLVNSRNGTKPPPSDNMPLIDGPSKKPALAAPAKSTPTFSPKTTTVLFVLGGPGAGKGTQCANLVKHHGFTHLSAGDLLRAEQDRPGSQFGQLIKDYIKDGLIVPMEVTVQLLENAMQATIDAAGPGAAEHRFLSRLPRDGRGLKATMEARLLERGKTSGRADDNAESIRKRFRTFVETSMPVVDYFAQEGRVIKIDATSTPEDVYEVTKTQLKALSTFERPVSRGH
ncbi:uridylate kinase [Verticillium dahliae]|nr:uridylate kinase [Verticillium dahliae]